MSGFLRCVAIFFYIIFLFYCTSIPLSRSCVSCCALSGFVYTPVAVGSFRYPIDEFRCVEFVVLQRRSAAQVALMLICSTAFHPRNLRRSLGPIPVPRHPRHHGITRYGSVALRILYQNVAIQPRVRRADPLTTRQSIELPNTHKLATVFGIALAITGCTVASLVGSEFALKSTLIPWLRSLLTLCISLLASSRRSHGTRCNVVSIRPHRSVDAADGVCKPRRKPGIPAALLSPSRGKGCETGCCRVRERHL